MNSSSLSTITNPCRAYTAEIDAALAKYVDFSDGCPGDLAAAIGYSLLAPGKRLRPALVLMSSVACGGTRQSALPLACAVEMIHCYSLIHDDLPAMDDDDLRRGRPTCHKAFSEAIAILAGDALLARAFEIVARDAPNPQLAAAACGELARAAGATRLVGGQAADLNQQGQVGDLATLEAIHLRKTGAMIRVAARLGGMAAAANTAHLNMLDRYGRDLGLAFQVTDDLLDVSGQQDAVGKRVGKDADRKKLTYPALLGIAESRTRAAQLCESACAAVAPLGEAAADLIQLAQFTLQRNS